MTEKEIQAIVEQLRAAVPMKLSLPLRDDICLTVNGVVWIPGVGFMHPISFKEMAGEEAYREILRRPRIVTSYDV